MATGTKSWVTRRHLYLGTTTAAGEVAAQAEERKCSKYNCLLVIHDFVPVAIETTGVMGPQTSLFLKELGRRVRGQAGDPLASLNIKQKLIIWASRGNCLYS